MIRDQYQVGVLFVCC